MPNKAPVAFATYFDTWAGPVTVGLMPFKTKRNGAIAIRYRWQTGAGATVGGFRSPFRTVEGALIAIDRHACFANGRRA